MSTRDEREARERSTPEQNVAAKELLFGRRYGRPSDVELVRKPLERLRDRLLFLTAQMPPDTAKDYLAEIDAALTALDRMGARSEVLAEAKLRDMERLRDGWRALARRLASPRLDLGLVKEGDLVDVTYGSYRTTQRVADVGYSFERVTILFEPGYVVDLRTPEDFGEDYRWSERP